MRPNTFKIVAVLIGGVLVLAGLSAATSAAEDAKDKPAPSGVWVQKGGELQIDFSDKGVVKIRPHGNDVIVILCKRAIEKDGQVKARVADFEGKEEIVKQLKEKLPIDTEFFFRWQVKGDAAKLDVVKGDDHLKSHLDGEYEPKK